MTLAVFPSDQRFKSDDVTYIHTYTHVLVQILRSKLQESRQKTSKLVKSPKGEITLVPSAPKSKRFKPAVTPFVNIFAPLCLSIQSNIGTEITAQIALRFGTTCDVPTLVDVITQCSDNQE